MKKERNTLKLSSQDFYLPGNFPYNCKNNTMKALLITLLSIGLLFSGCSSARKLKEEKAIYQSETLSVLRIAPDVYQHITYLQTNDFGKVPCNGMIVVSGKEAIVFDTPADSVASIELINWVERELRSRIVAVIPTHFHGDCLGGLKEFHDKGIASYANNLTIALAKENKMPVPQHGFDNAIELKVGATKVSARFFGEGHTRDNVVGYFADQNIMFGGCLIKEVGAGKGFLGDANVHDWSATVQKVKQQYPDVKIVIPGHGETGGTKLLDYTIQLFQHQ